MREPELSSQGFMDFPVSCVLPQIGKLVIAWISRVNKMSTQLDFSVSCQAEHRFPNTSIHLRNYSLSRWHASGGHSLMISESST